MNKSTLRKNLTALRYRATEADPGAGEKLADVFFADGPKVEKGMVIAGIWPIRTEIDARPLMERLMAADIDLALPHAPDRKGRLDFREYNGGTPPAMDAWGIPAPKAEAPVMLPDMVLVPLLGFDAKGGRIGYGEGLYDRALVRLRAQKRRVVAVGVAFAAQEVGTIPREPHDAVLDWVITEEGVKVRPSAK